MPVDIEVQVSLLRELISRTTLANLVAFALVVSAMGFFMWTENTEMVKTLGLLGSGWLLKEVKNNV